MKKSNVFLILILSFSLMLNYCIPCNNYVMAKKSAKSSSTAKKGKASKKKNKKSKSKAKASGASKKNNKNVKVEGTVKKLTMIQGESFDSNLGNKYSYTSSNSSVVAVKGGVFKAKDAGSAVVVCKSGKKAISYKITVYEVNISNLSIEVDDEDDLDKSGNLILYVDEEDDDDDEYEEDEDYDDEDEDYDDDDDDDEIYELSVSFTAKLNGKKISKSKAIKLSSGLTWSSSNKKVVTVDKDGNLTAVSKGKSVISVTLGKKTAKLTVYVYDVDDIDDDDDDEDDDD